VELHRAPRRRGHRPRPRLIPAPPTGGIRTAGPQPRPATTGGASLQHATRSSTSAAPRSPSTRGSHVTGLLLAVHAALPEGHDFADGNRCVLVRFEEGEQKQYNLRLEDLIRDADLSANTDMRPGDIIIIPESWF
jgi:hypothetical protein